MSRSGNIDTSQRLQKALRALGDNQWHTSLELSKLLHNPALSATITDLRNNGYEIERQYAGKSEAGQKIHKYRLIPKAGQIDLGMSGIKRRRYG
jgi:hypothetical protein